MRVSFVHDLFRVKQALKDQRALLANSRMGYSPETDSTAGRIRPQEQIDLKAISAQRVHLRTRRCRTKRRRQASGKRRIPLDDRIIEIAEMYKPRLRRSRPSGHTATSKNRIIQSDRMNQLIQHPRVIKTKSRLDTSDKSNDASRVVDREYS